MTFTNRPTHHQQVWATYATGAGHYRCRSKQNSLCYKNGGVRRPSVIVICEHALESAVSKRCSHRLFEEDFILTSYLHTSYTQLQPRFEEMNRVDVKIICSKWSVRNFLFVRWGHRLLRSHVNVPFSSILLASIQRKFGTCNLSLNLVSPVGPDYHLSLLN